MADIAARLQTGYRKAKREQIKQGKAEVIAKIKAERESGQWARDREAWLRAPIKGSDHEEESDRA